MSLAQLQEMQRRNRILLVGVPGSGRSIFSQQVALKSLAWDRSIIYVTPEDDPSKAEASLK